MVEKSFCRITIDETQCFVFSDIPYSLVQLNESALEYFNVTLCNGTDVYCGKVYLSDIARMASAVDMEGEKYYTILRKCLCKGEDCKSMLFTYHLAENSESTYKFLWKQVLDEEMKFQLGSMILTKEVTSSIKTNEIFSYFSEHLKTLTSEVGRLTRANEKLEAEKHGMTKCVPQIIVNLIGLPPTIENCPRLENYVDIKEAMEQELFTKFALVLNEKKTRIRGLKKKLESGDVKGTQGKDSDADSTGRTGDHGDTDTDEENERQKNTKSSSKGDLDMMLGTSSSRIDLEDSPKKCKKRIRKGKPKESVDTILLPRVSAPSKPSKPVSDDLPSSTSEPDIPMPAKKYKSIEITEDDLLDELMF